jgi:cell wall-associated NlpC family hydrolase
MAKYCTLLFFTFLLIACGSSKKTTTSKRTTATIKSSNRGPSNNIIDHAKTFQGTPYKYGGTTIRGMDCSGLVYVAFQQEDIQLPRVSRDMAKKGKRISITKANEGDLVFFQTNKNNNQINHVGLVVSNKKGVLKFIHSTSSKGVIISSLDERYWKSAFVEARNIL